MKSFRHSFSFLALGLVAVSSAPRLSAQACADSEFEAKKIVFQSDVLPIQKVGFFPYDILTGGSSPAAKYATESWSGSGSYWFQDIFSGWTSEYSNMSWSGSWTFDTTTGSDTSTKRLAYHKYVSGSGYSDYDQSGLKLSMGSLGSEVGAGNSTSGTSRNYLGTGDDTRNVTETLSNSVSLSQAQAYGEAHKTQDADGLQFWNNFPTAEQVKDAMQLGTMNRLSPLPAPARRVSFQAQFCVPCIGSGQFLITYFYKKWAVGAPEPAEMITRTETVEFRDAPYLVPQTGMQPYHFELEQGQQCKLVKVTARSLAECAKREPGSSTAALKSVDMNFFLGKRTDGLGAGSLALAGTGVSAALYSPAGLQLLAEAHADVTVIKSGDVLRQIKAPEALADIVTIDTSSYEIRFYLPSQVGALASGVYTVSGQPFVSYLVENPDAGSETNRLRITEMKGSAEKVTLFSEASGSLTMSTGNGLRVEQLETTLSGGTIVETRTVKDSANETVSVVRETKRDFAFGRNVTQVAVDPSGANLVTSHSYYENASTDGGNYGQIQQTVEPSGRWTRYTYDAQGRPATTVSQFLDSAPGSAASDNRVTAITYGTIADVDGDSQPEELVTTINSLKGQESGLSYEVVFSQLGSAYGAGVRTRWLIQATVAGAAWDAATNLVTKRRVIDSGIWFTKPLSELRPDGTLTTYDYAVDGSHFTTTIHAGEANGAGSAVVAGTRSHFSMLYAISIAIIVGHIVMAGLLFRYWKKCRRTACLLALAIWMIPSIQLYFDSLVSALSGWFGESFGFIVFQWGRSVIFLAQLVAACLLVSSLRKGKCESERHP